MSTGYWANLGQLSDMEENSTMEAAFISDGAYPLCFPGNSSVVSFIAAEYSADSLQPDTLFRWDMRLQGDNVAMVDPVGFDARPDHRNFYLPHCSDGVTNVLRYGRVIYSDVYPGIDLHLYTTLGGQKMAFVCAPGSDPSSIKLAFDGSLPSLSDEGALVFNVLDQAIHFPKPFAYQFNDNEVLVLEQEGFGFAMDGGEFTFSVGQYAQDGALVLLIDQTTTYKEMGGGPDLEGICWSTYFGGNKFDWIHASATDPVSNYFIVGETGSTFPQFPSTGIPAITPSTSYNTFAAKFNSQDHLLWSTIVGGGAATSTIATTVAVANSVSNSNVYVGGWTNSSSLPVLSSGTAYFDGTGTSSNQGFLFRLSTFNGFMTWNTYFGSTGSRVFDLNFLGANQLIVTGDALTSLPTPQVAAPPGATTYSYGGGQDAFVALFNTSDQLRWISHYGGIGTESGRSIVPFGKSFYVLGQTESNNVPIVNKSGAYNDASYSGQRDLFILLFNANAVNQWATYFGGSSWEDVFYSQNMSVHPNSGTLYIVGTTGGSSASFPLLNGGLGSYNSAGSGLNEHGFIARFNGSTQALQWSTMFGGGLLGRMAVTVNSSGDVFTSGMVDGDFMPITPAQPFTYDQPLVNWNTASYGLVEQDCYVARFTSANALDWCTYFGGVAGTGYEEMNSLVFKDYWLYAAGLTTKYQNPSSFFPLVPHADPMAYYDPTWNENPVTAGYDGYIVKFCPDALPRPEHVEKANGSVGENTPRLIPVGSGLYRFVGPGRSGLLSIHNSLGQEVKSFHLDWDARESASFSLDGLSLGVYVVSMSGMPPTKLFLQP